MAATRVTGLREFEVELSTAASRTLPEVAKVVGQGANNIKKDWRRRWSGMPHIARLPYTIGYDVFTLPGSVKAEIGPDHSKNRLQGPLANIIEFGSPTSAPIPGGQPALDTESPKFETALAALTVRLLP